jgi:hypothetical protein
MQTRNERIARIALTEIAEASTDLFTVEERTRYVAGGDYTSIMIRKMRRIAQDALKRMDEENKRDHRKWWRE